MADLHQLCQRMRAFGRTGARIESWNVAEEAEELVAFARVHRDIKSCKVLITEVDKTIVMRGDRALARRAMLNLILNAAEATEGRGTIELRCTRTPGGNVCVEVDDNGPGIPEVDRERVFDPFFTTKPTGTGLGLMAVKVHVAEWGGVISVHKSPLGGARLRIVVPPVMGGKLAEDEQRPEADAIP